MADLGTIGGRGKARITGVTHLRLTNYHQPLSFQAGRNDSEGNPASPSLEMKYPSTFHFRWAVRAGTRSISIFVKQAINLSPRPSITVKANASIGVNSDVVAYAASGTGWTTAGPAIITPTGDGVVYVEIASNTTKEGGAPCYFDHITTT